MRRYFIYNDVLRQVMGSAFGEIIEQLFNPEVTFTGPPDRDPKTGKFITGTTVGKIKIRVFRNPSDVGVFKDALNRGNWAAASDDRSLLSPISFRGGRRPS